MTSDRVVSVAHCIQWRSQQGAPVVRRSASELVSTDVAAAEDAATSSSGRRLFMTAQPIERTPIMRRESRRPRPADPARGPGFASLGVPVPLTAALAAAGIDTPFPIQAAVLPDALAGADILGRGQTGSGKTLAFCIPLVARLAGGHTSAGRPRGLVLVPTRELASQVQAALRPLTTAVGPECRHDLRRHAATPAGGGAAQPGRHRRRLPGPSGRPDRPGPLPSRRRRGQRGRRGRPHGRPRLPARRAQAAGRDPAGRPADAVLGDSRPRRRRPGPPVPRSSGRACRRSARRARARSSTTCSPSPPPTGRPWSPYSRAGDNRSLVFTRTKHGARKLARQLTAARIPAAELHGNLTQARPRAQPRARSPAARSAYWSPPTSPPAASTWTASTWSSTPTRPPSTRPTCTGPAGPAGPAPRRGGHPADPRAGGRRARPDAEGTRPPARRHRQARLRAAALDRRETRPAARTPASLHGCGTGNRRHGNPRHRPRRSRRLRPLPRTAKTLTRSHVSQVSGQRPGLRPTGAVRPGKSAGLPSMKAWASPDRRRFWSRA